MILYRPVGEKELELIKQGGFKEFPPRLPEQPIFYPVLSREYAQEIASMWNTKDPASGCKGYVLEFEIDDAFIASYKVHEAGGKDRQEYWIPSEGLKEFNKYIIGLIRIVDSYEP